MAVTLTIDGTEDYVTTNLSGYAATEDATPIDPSLASGGVGQLNFDITEDVLAYNELPHTRLLMGSEVTLGDGSNGTTTATVTGLDSNDGVVSVTALSRLGKLLASRSAAPQSGTIEQTLRYYLGLAGITSGIVFVPETATEKYLISPAVNFPVPGWVGEIWTNLREFAIAVGAEISLVSNNVTFRPLRKRVAVDKRNSSESWSISQGDIARTVEVKYYNNTYGTNLVYPNNVGWNPDVQVYQVDAGEVLEFNEPINASLTSVEQPVCLAYVGPTSTISSYSVIGADGLAIPVEQWLANGGSVDVSIGEDTKSLNIKITGAMTTQGPYRIAAGSGPSDSYSSLRIRGTGVTFSETVMTFPTGAADSETAQVVGATVENPFISSAAQAATLGMRTAARYSGTTQSISISTVGINRAGTSESLRYPTFDEFSNGVGGQTTAWAGQTFNAFNTAWTGKTFNQFNDTYLALVRADFDNQAFGNIAGARVKYQDAFYRIDAGTVTEVGVTYSGTMDTLFADFTATWTLQDYERFTGGPTPARDTAYTFNDFNTILAGRTFNDLARMPLWRTYAGYPVN